MMNDDLVDGGQGRDARNLHDSAWGIVVVALICLAISAALCIFVPGCAAAERRLLNMGGSAGEAKP